jgi:xanthine/uracil/vitamin C permease (AzgA family)
MGLNACFAFTVVTQHEVPWPVALGIALPAFVTIVLIPLTCSLTQGMLWGFLLHAILHVVVGRWRDGGITLWILAAMPAGLLVLGG